MRKNGNTSLKETSGARLASCVYQLNTEHHAIVSEQISIFLSILSETAALKRRVIKIERPIVTVN